MKIRELREEIDDNGESEKLERKINYVLKKFYSLSCVKGWGSLNQRFLRFPVCWQILCGYPLNMNKKEAWEFIKCLEETGYVKIIKFRGLKILYSVS